MPGRRRVMRGAVGDYIYKCARRYLGVRYGRGKSCSRAGDLLGEMARYYVARGAQIVGDTAFFLEQETGKPQSEWLDRLWSEKENGPVDQSSPYANWFLRCHLQIARELSQISLSRSDTSTAMPEAERRVNAIISQLSSREVLDNLFPETMVEQHGPSLYANWDEETKHRFRIIAETKFGSLQPASVPAVINAAQYIERNIDVLTATQAYLAPQRISGLRRIASSIGAGTIALAVTAALYSENLTSLGSLGLLALMVTTYLGLRTPLDLFVTMIGPKWNTILSLDLEKDGIPPGTQVAICVSTILTSKSQIDEVLSKTVHNIISSNDCFVCAVVLYDLPDSKHSTVSMHENELIEYIHSRASLLRENELKNYSNSLFALGRPREFDASQALYSGRERKRGKIDAVIGAINGDASQFNSDRFNWISRCSSITHILCLDDDALVLRGCVTKLVAAAIHPLNKRRIATGFGIFVPESLVNSQSIANSIKYVALPMAASLSDSPPPRANVYQLLNGVGLYHGKALIDVKSYTELCLGLLPQSSVLSHDTVEGIMLSPLHVPGAYLLEDMPSNSIGYFDRAMRWTRGDWQNVPVIARRAFLFHLKPDQRIRALRLITWQIATAANNGLFLVLLAYFVRDRQWAAVLILCLATAGTTLLLKAIGIIGRSEINGYRRMPLVPLDFAMRITQRTAIAPLSLYCYIEATTLAMARLISGKNLLQWRAAALGAKRSTALRMLIGSATISLVTSWYLLRPEASIPGMAVAAASWFSPILVAIDMLKTNATASRCSR